MRQILTTRNIADKPSSRFLIFGQPLKYSFVDQVVMWYRRHHLYLDS